MSSSCSMSFMRLLNEFTLIFQVWWRTHEHVLQLTTGEMLQSIRWKRIFHKRSCTCVSEGVGCFFSSVRKASSLSVFFLFLAFLSFLFYPFSLSSDPKPVPRWLSWVCKQLHNRNVTRDTCLKTSCFPLTQLLFKCFFSFFPASPVWSEVLVSFREAVPEFHPLTLWKHEEAG